MTALMCLGLAFSQGCRGRAYEDAYQAKLANEIRVLEDQLYEADYQNRVLRDKLRRTRDSSVPSLSESDLPGSVPVDSGSVPVDMMGTDPDRSSRIPIPVPVPMQSGDSGYDVLDLDHLDSQPADKGADQQSELPTEIPTPPPISDLEKPSQLPGQPADSQEGDSDEAASKPGLGMPTEAQPAPNQVPDERQGNIGELPAPMEAVPPAELIPPGGEQLIEDPIVPGPPAPPSNDQGNEPPGRVNLPANVRQLQFESTRPPAISLPDHLEIHDGLSGGHQFDEDPEIDGLYLIVTVSDQAGQIIALDHFDVDAELTVVVEDPRDHSDDSRVGRWDFTPAEVRQMIHKQPIDGIHIPIQWQDRAPAGDDVIVHIRMAAVEEEMRCQGRVQLKQSIAASNWLPRG